MRVLVGLHHLELGGSQLNALDLALRMREHGHRVSIFGTHDGPPGPVATMAREAGLPVTLFPYPHERPQRARPYRLKVARALTAAVREHRAELLHVYEFPLILDAFHGPHLRLGTPVAGTIYAMDVPSWLPRYPQLVVGSQEILEQAAAFRDRPTLIEPPVNTDLDHPDRVDGATFRAEHGIRPDELAVVVVTRLEPDMKAEGIGRAIDAVELLDDPRLRLIIVGGGPSFTELEAKARRTNAVVGRQVVVMTGSLADPRPAYAGADISLGMGGSALRAMAFGKPLVVLGVGGYSRQFTPETVGEFMHAGFFGVGEGDLDPKPLADQIATLADDAGARAELGEWSRQLVLDRFSLNAAADTLLEVYTRAAAGSPGVVRRFGEATRTTTRRVIAELAPRGIKNLARRVKA